MLWCILPPDHKGLVTRNTNSWLKCETLQCKHHINNNITYYAWDSISIDGGALVAAVLGMRLPYSEETT